MDPFEISKRTTVGLERRQATPVAAKIISTLFVVRSTRHIISEKDEGVIVSTMLRSAGPNGGGNLLDYGL